MRSDDHHHEIIRPVHERGAGAGVLDGLGLRLVQGRPSIGEGGRVGGRGAAAVSS